MRCVVCDDLGCEFCPKVDPYDLAISMGVDLLPQLLDPFDARAMALALSEHFGGLDVERVQYGISARVGK